ncbi:hypothetical protein V2J09_009982 [Rumex salicifolius]
MATPINTSPDSGSSRRGGGWITFPFILGAAFGLSLAGSGWLINLVVYMIEEFHLESIRATQGCNLIYGFSNLIPVVGAVLADSFLGSFHVILISALCSLLGMIILSLTAMLPSLRPPKCKLGSLLCNPPSNRQTAMLYIGSVLGCIGLGGSRFTIATMGADQFDHIDKIKSQEIFFNWYFFMQYTAAIIGSTAIIYVEDNVSWGLGFSLCIVSSLLALLLFVTGTRFYVLDKKQQGSPFTSLFQTLVAATRNMREPSSSRREDYYDGAVNGSIQPSNVMLSKGFSCLNKAAWINTNQLNHSSQVRGPWRLSTVRQVEDLKALIRIFPIWSTGILLCTSIAINNSLTILQALAMDRHVGPSFKIPAGSMLVFMLASTSASLTVIDRLLYPCWKKLTGRHPTLLQRIGVGHIINIFGMILSALVESRRLNQQQPMLALWLAPQLVAVGIGEAFHYAGQVAFYYREFPDSLRSTSTAMQAVIIGISYYLSSFVIGVVRKLTKWLPDDVSHGRLDNVYWMLSVISGLNFVFYLICTRLYKSSKQGSDNKNVGDEQTN